ncbi:MAG: hypothetical protein ABJO02_09350 [Reichenbachiella sp.]|uniref:hypothetical protein n=1 Tax=Reichenbachiella sp. TaxID=2184521 RepID=UPI003297AA38
MKTSLLFSFLLLCFTSYAQPQWGASLNMLFGAGEAAYADPPDGYADMSSAVMLNGNVGFPWGDWLLGGGYFHAVPGIDVGGFDASFIELGFFLGPNFEIADDHELRVTAEIGFRQWFSSDQDNMSALGTNLLGTFIINKDNKISPAINLGFNAQPAGGNDDVFFSHSPQMFIGGGIIIHPD